MHPLNLARILMAVLIAISGVVLIMALSSNEAGASRDNKIDQISYVFVCPQSHKGEWPFPKTPLYYPLSSI